MPQKTPDIIEKMIIKIYTEDLKGPMEIGRAFNLDRNTIRSILKRNNITIRGKRNMLDQADYIIAEYKKGRSAKDIATELGTYNTSVRRVLRKYNVPIRPNGFHQRKVNVNPFERLDNPDVQYWIGFIAADGNISKHKPCIRLNCGQKDKDHLLKYAKWLGNDVKVTEQLNTRFKTLEYCVGFTLFEAKELLVKLGITPVKSKTLKIKMPLTWHFVRGYFDGDGSIGLINNRVPSVSIATASFKFLSQLNSFLTKEGIFHSISQAQSTFKIYINKKSFERFKNLLYKDAETYLERKAQKFGVLPV